MAGRRRRFWLKLVVMAGILAAVGFYLRGMVTTTPPPQRLVGRPASQQVTSAPTPTTAASQPVDPRLEPHVVPPPPANPTTQQVADAKSLYERGLQLQSQSKLIEARQALSDALSGGLLPDDLATTCRQHLTEITREVIFSRKVFPDDPYAYRYVVKPGDLLITIVRKEELWVSSEAVQQINDIKDAKRIQIGQWLKLIRGPFDAIVTKHNFTLDLYQHGMFVKTYKVGLGQNGSTPVGAWMVAPGGRVRHAPWTPPPTAEGERVIQWGQPGYPLGTEGFWISLRGLDANTENLRGFGIHGTNEPDSIGKQASLGCVRLADPDIAELFGLLCEGKSRVEIRP